MIWASIFFHLSTVSCFSISRTLIVKWAVHVFSLWRVCGSIRSPYPSSWTPNCRACVCLCVCVFVFVFVACMWVQPLALLVRSSVSPNCVIFIHEWRNKAACPPLSSCPSTIIHHSYDKYGRTDLCVQQWHHNHNICWKRKVYGFKLLASCCAVLTLWHCRTKWTISN